MKTHPHFGPTARPMRGYAAAQRRQHGAVIITVALALLFLLGFMGIALDFGRLFVLRTELQTATDSCALAAAQELDGASDARDRAFSAGLTAGNLNRVQFQGSNAGIAASDISFSSTLNGSYSSSFPYATAKYAKCQRAQTGIKPWLLQALGAFSGNSAYGNSQSVSALAVATRAPSQTNCLMPIGICQKSAGFSRGEWISGVTNSNDEIEASGAFKWLDYTGPGGGAKEIKDLLAGNGACNLPGTSATVTDASKNGKTNGAVDAWNTRFGIYKGSYNQTDSPPDETGYAWYATDASAVNPGRYDAIFSTKRSTNAPYEGDNKNPDTKGLKTNGSYGSTDYTKGGNRRIMTVGMVDCTAPKLQLTGFACVLALHPMAKAANGKSEKMWLEFIGDASATTGNPCATGGLAGSNGPLVPVLVQ